ncbi:MAG TPA: hypothetical protein VHA12_00160 [Candidatus Nanoarchaeia archaeon]|nr:hypothetical protein [Candidatus Nanoarchaeia archaeon]
MTQEEVSAMREKAKADWIRLFGKRDWNKYCKETSQKSVKDYDKNGKESAQWGFEQEMTLKTYFETDDRVYIQIKNRWPNNPDKVMHVNGTISEWTMEQDYIMFKDDKTIQPMKIRKADIAFINYSRKEAPN